MDYFRSNFTWEVDLTVEPIIADLLHCVQLREEVSAACE